MNQITWATFIPIQGVVAALNAQGIVDKVPTRQRDLAAIQAFNTSRRVCDRCASYP